MQNSFRFLEDTRQSDLTALIMARQNKTIIDGVEIVLPKHSYSTMTYKERLRLAEKEAKGIIKLLS